jgi:hypothetical protein
MASDPLFELVSSTGTVHRIEASGIFTNGICRPFPSPIPAAVDRAATSFSGHFLYFRIRHRLHLITIAASRLHLDELAGPPFVDAAFACDESKLIAMTNGAELRVFRLLPVALLCRLVFESPERPLSLRIHDLGRGVTIKCESARLLYELPARVVSGPAPLPLAPLEPISPPARSADEPAGATRFATCSLLQTPDVRACARSVHRRMVELAAKQEELIERFGSIQQRILAAERRSRDIQGRQQVLRDGALRLGERIHAVVDGPEELLAFKALGDRFIEQKRQTEEVLCDDDSVSDSQAREFRGLAIGRRIEELEAFLRSRQPDICYF